MSWSDEELDAIFKEASLQQKVPVYQDAYFDEIASLLPQKRNRRKGIFWIFGSVASLVAVSLTYFSIHSSNKQDAPKLAKHNPRIEIKETKEISKNEQNTLFDNNTNSPSNTTSKTNTNKAISNKNIELHSFNSFSFSELGLSENNVSEQSNNFNKIENKVEDNKTEALNLKFNTDNVSNFFHPLILNELLANPFPVKTSPHSLNIHAMAGFSGNFIKNQEGSQRPIFGASLGMNYEYQLKDYSFSVGLAYVNYQTHDLNLNRTSKVYGFEVNKYSQIIDYKSISFVQVPISAGKSFGNHKLSFGLTPSYVFGSTVDFSKTQNGVLLEDSRIYFNKLGLNNFALSAHIAYDLKVAKNYSFGVSLSNLLLNPLDEKRFEGSINKLPFQANISLKKYFTIK